MDGEPCAVRIERELPSRWVADRDVRECFLAPKLDAVDDQAQTGLLSVSPALECAFRFRASLATDKRQRRRQPAGHGFDGDRRRCLVSLWHPRSPQSPSARRVSGGAECQVRGCPARDAGGTPGDGDTRAGSGGTQARGGRDPKRGATTRASHDQCDTSVSLSACSGLPWRGADGIRSAALGRLWGNGTSPTPGTAVDPSAPRWRAATVSTTPAAAPVTGDLCLSWQQATARPRRVGDGHHMR
jgi:hypothetical protein